ncbi:MAG: hypothetical protein QN190_14135 [Armatimonadota bacterium]|nr:hypothetical protein [Armatimonadota bacterium]
MTVPIDNTRRAILADVLPEYLAARAERLAAEKRERRAAELLRSWLRANGERELIDAETGLGVRLRERQGAPAYDAVAIRERDPALWQRLVDLGCVAVDHRAVRAQERAGQIGGLDPYRIPGSVTEALIVVEGQ